MTPKGWEGLEWKDLKLPLDVWFIVGCCAAVIILAPWQ